MTVAFLVVVIIMIDIMLVLYNIPPVVGAMSYLCMTSRLHLRIPAWHVDRWFQTWCLLRCLHPQFALALTATLAAERGSGHVHFWRSLAISPMHVLCEHRTGVSSTLKITTFIIILVLFIIIVIIIIFSIVIFLIVTIIQENIATRKIEKYNIDYPARLSLPI